MHPDAALTPVDVLAILLALVSAMALLNARLFKLPMTIGLVVGGLLTSLLLIGVDAAFGAGLAVAMRDYVRGIDFPTIMLDWLLPFLLFAGALRISLRDLAASKWSILLVATGGVLISTFLIGVGFWWLAGIPPLLALVFGAIISPTDPVAVLGILRLVKVPPALETKIAGESLFNDGVGVVLFLILSTLAFGRGAGAEAMAEQGIVMAALTTFVWEVGGGMLLGAVLGGVAYLMLRSADDFVIETLVTLTLVVATTAIAAKTHASAPIAVVVAGLFIGNIAAGRAIRTASWAHVEATWHMVDEALNAILFLLIGIEVLAIGFRADLIWLGLATIPLVLLARFAAVGLPIALLRLRRTFDPGTVRIMTWGGLRGGISIALALSLPPDPWTPAIQAATYVVVVFSIIVQGLTIRPVIGRVLRG